MLHDFEDADLTEWEDCGGSSWYIDPSTGHESKFSLRSGPIDCTGISRICREVKGPAEVTFWWQYEPLRQGIAELTFTADNTRRVCDSSEWSPISYTVRDNNTHQLIWEFRKIKCYPKSTGAGWIDDVCISSEALTIPSEIKRGNISDGNMSCEARVISSGVIVELSNFTIVANEVTMETTNVTINPSGDVVINTNEVNISPDKVSMNTSEVKISPAKVVMGNVTMNASGDVLINPDGVSISSENITMDNSNVAISAGEITVGATGVTNVMLNTSVNTTTSAIPVIQSINVTVDSILSPVKVRPLQQDASPSVSLISPKDSSKFFVGNTIAFKFKPTDDDDVLEKCILYIGGHEVNNSTNIKSDSEADLLHIFNTPGIYNWNIVCEDHSHQRSISDYIGCVSIQPYDVYVDKNKTKGLDESGRMYYSSIQEAIDDVVENMTVIVEPGIYEENLIIDKSISIRGNKSEFGAKPKVIGRNNIVTIESSNVEFNDFEISGSSGPYARAICAENCGNISITNNTIVGFTQYAIYICNGFNINVTKNNLSGSGVTNDGGVCLNRGNSSNISHNNITDVYNGIEIYHHDSPSIKDNYVKDAAYGICIISSEGCNDTVNMFNPSSPKNNCCEDCEVTGATSCYINT
jgi:hypothetical protein